MPFEGNRIVLLGGCSSRHCCERDAPRRERAFEEDSYCPIFVTQPASGPGVWRVTIIQPAAAALPALPA